MSERKPITTMNRDELIKQIRAWQQLYYDLSLTFQKTQEWCLELMAERNKK